MGQNTRQKARKMNFTKAAIEALPPAPVGKRTYVYDEKTRGLGLRVTDSGHKVFVLYRWVSGRPERVTLGPWPDLTVELARKRAQELNGAIAVGKNPAEDKRAVRAEMTLEELFKLWIERYAKAHRKRWEEAEAYLNRYLEHLKQCKLSAIRKAHVQALHVKVSEEHGKVAANRLASLLRAIFNKAADWGYEGPNPALGVRKFPERARERFLQADELPNFFKAVAEEANDAVRDFILVSLLTGARRGNVLAMRWDEVNLERATWTIPAAEAKTGDTMTVALVPEAVTILTERQGRAKGEYVFPAKTKSGHLATPKTAWARILKRAGIPDLHLHDLRRTLGSWQAAQGASLVIIGKSLGHKNVSTTAIYSRLNLDPVRRSVEAATKAMLAAGGLVPQAEVKEMKKKRAKAK